MKHKLMQLLLDNASRLQNRTGAGEPVIRAETVDDGVHLYVYDVIDAWYGASAAALVTALTGAAGKTVHLHINSPGGDVFEARAMSAALVAHDGKVVAHIDGVCASAATYLALAANEVRMVQGALFMIHNSWSMAFGNKSDLRSTADLLDKIDGQIAQDYATKTGKPVDDIAALMDAETWFTPEEALAAGFIDAIDANSKAGQNQAPAWDLSAFAHAPQPAAPKTVHTPAPDDKALLDAQAAQQLQMNRNRLRLLSPI